MANIDIKIKIISEVVYIISLKDINKAVVTQVTEELKSTIYKDAKFASTSITEKIIRPSFYVDFQNNKTNLMLKNARERNVELKLFYFAKNIKNSKLELMEIQDLLSNIFINCLKINDENYCHIHGCDFDVVKDDGYLTLDIELYLLERLEEEGTEPLEELHVDTKIN